MYLTEQVGKGILVTTTEEWSSSSGNTARYEGPKGQKESVETLAGVDSMGIWIERGPGFHKVVPGRDGEENNIKLHILVPWSAIVHLAVVVEGLPQGDPETGLLVGGKSPVGF